MQLKGELQKDLNVSFKSRSWWQRIKFPSKNMVWRRQNACFSLYWLYFIWLLSDYTMQELVRGPFFLKKKKKLLIFLSSFGSLQVMDVLVCASLLLCSLALPHLLFPHKNSYRWEGEASEGWARGWARGLLVRFVLNPCLERKLSLPGDLRAVGLLEELVRFPACNHPPSEHKT